MIRDQLFHQDGPSDPRDSQPLVDPGDENEAWKVVSNADPGIAMYCYL